MTRPGEAGGRGIMKSPELGAVVLGDIVERNFVEAERGGKGGRPPTTPFSPVRALPQRPFPRYNPTVRYGLAGGRASPCGGGPSQEGGGSAHIQPEEALSGGGGSAGPFFSSGMGGGPSTEGVDHSDRGLPLLPVGGGAVGMARPNAAHRWRPEEFRRLYRGYYRWPLPVRVMEGLSLAGPMGSADGVEGNLTVLTGEAFFNELFRCLRSTVRRHQYLALHVLLLHLWHAPEEEDGVVPAATPATQPGVSLRERCVQGPDCGAFVFFVLEVLSTAAHPAACKLAAACLLMLLRQEKDEFVEVISEIGAPLSDPLDDDATAEHGEEDMASKDASRNGKVQQEGAGGGASEIATDGLELPFSEISELLRDDEDRRIGLEKMGYTNRIMMAMHMLLFEPSSSSALPATGDSDRGSEEPTFGVEQLWLQLLLYGDISSPRVARRVAEDPAFTSWSKQQLQRVVLGERPMASLTRHLLLWYRLVRVPAAGRALLQPTPSLGGYEPWELFIIFACTVKPEEGVSMDAVKALMLTFMLVREMVRHGLAGDMLRSVSEVLLTDGLRVGAAMVLEMWVLATEQQSMHAGGEREQNRLRSGLTASNGHPRMEADYFCEAALAAMELCRSGEVVPSPEQEDAAQQALHYLVNATCRHYLATYFMAHPIACFRLHGAVVETQRRMQGFLSHCVLRSDLLTESFLRLSLPLPQRKQLSDVIGRVVVDCLSLHTYLPEELTGVAEQQVEGAGRTMPAHPTSLLEFTTQRQPSQHWQLALKAAVTHANARLMHAIACSFPAINKDAILGYAASLSAKYISSCLGIRSRAQHCLLLDEVCTAVEVMLVLQEFTAAEGGGRKSQGEEAGIACPPSSGEAMSKKSLPLQQQRHAPFSGPSYRREAELTALFVLQSMAITKQCLDAAPLAIACVLGQRPDVASLGRALQHGVEAASEGGGGGGGGAQRPWAIAPLYDDDLTAKAPWAAWLCRMLRLHQDVKRVLSWEALLSHTLLWVLARRQELFLSENIPFDLDEKKEEEEEEEEEKGVVAATRNPNPTASALVGLVTDLAGLLHSPNPCDAGWGEGVVFSPAASEALGVALRAFTNAEAEDGLPWPITAALTLTATRCAPSTGLSVGRVLLVTPVIPRSGQVPVSQCVAQFQLLEGLLAWKTHRSVCKTPRWSLEDVVSLIQLLGVFLAGFDGEFEDVITSEMFSVDDWTRLVSDAEGFRVWCVCALVEGVFHDFLEERQRRCNERADGKLLSFMEREVLRSTLGEICWEPRVLWPHLQD